MSEETKVDITCDISKRDQEYICEIVADYLTDKGIEWDTCSFTLVAEYDPEDEIMEAIRSGKFIYNGGEHDD